MKLPAAQREAVINALSYPHGFARLQCDGHQVDAVVSRVSKRTMRYEIAVYVDEKLEGARLKAGDEIGGKFYAARKVRLYSAAERAKIEKAVGKRAARKHWKLDGVVEYRSCTYRTARAFLAHIEKHNQSIELLLPAPQQASLGGGDGA
jgi:hypothetical protein